MSERRVARVQLESPVPQLDRLFDYAVPHPLVADIAPGVRVKVPLRSAGRMMDAFVIEVVADDGSERPLSSVEAVVSPMPVLPERLYTLARRVADRAAGSISDILRLAVPKRMVRAEKAWAAAPAPTAPEVVPAAHERAVALLAPYAGLAAALDAGERIAIDAPPHPHAELPRGAWADLLAAAAVQTLARGRSAVLVVPDYRDQAQLLAALGEIVSADAIVRDDSDQSGPARYAQYLRTLAPVPCIVVGRRSAVYAPAHDTGLVAVWDDGDTLLSEPLAPGVHARDAALVRQEIEGSALLFAGHTRTTDVQRLVEVGYVREIPQTRRPSPRVVLSATREGEQRQSRVPSSAFAAAREALQHGPVLVQVARPGYAPPSSALTAAAPRAARTAPAPCARLVPERRRFAPGAAAAPTPGRADTAARRNCAWRRRAASAPPTSSAAPSRTPG